MMETPVDRAGNEKRKARFLFVSFLAIVVALGALFRFSYLDRKFFYGDEVVSSLRESGHTESDFARTFDGKVRTVRDISRYLSDRSTRPEDTIRSLAAEDPQHPPLYYLAARYWTQVLGDTTATRRSLAAVFGTLALLGVFWLAYEVFGSLAIAGIATALVAISPFHVIYSQQNREYSAWLFFLALQGALLLRALRRPAPARWAAYGACLVAALYTDALVLYGLVSFTLYVALRERRWSAILRDYAIATTLACLAYLPWLLVLYKGAGTITGWMGPLRVAVSAQIYLLKWLFNTAAVFFDMEYEQSRLIPIAIVVLLAVAGAFALTLKNLPRDARVFVLSLTFVPALAFVASDVMAHTSRATAPRYLVPVWLGCELAVAYAIGWLLADARQRTRRVAGLAALAFFVACGVGSNLANLPSRQTSSTAEMGRLGPEARAINAVSDPLVVYVHDGSHWDIAVAMLATELRPDVRLQLFERIGDARIAKPDAGFFLYEASTATKTALEQTTGGRWSAVRLDPFGSQFVNRLRRKANADREGSFGRYAENAELWQRLPDAAARVGRATMRARVRATNAHDV